MLMIYSTIHIYKYGTSSVKLCKYKSSVFKKIWKETESKDSWIFLFVQSRNWMTACYRQFALGLHMLL